ncbi:MAG: hypothetical protein K8Q88_02980 [Nitrosarchaeum sp.]|nr:hypothetical protein [Nitrosarchaeum sp.]
MFSFSKSLSSFQVIKEMKVELLIIGVILMISVSVIPSYATIFQEKLLESDSVRISFGDDMINSNGNVTPTIKTVELKSNVGSILVKNPIFRAMGNSFAIKSFEDSTIIYGINKGPTFNLHTLIFVEGNTIKLNDVAKFSISEISKQVIPEETVSKTNHLNMLVQSMQTTYNAKDLHFDVKTFDKSKYSGNDFQNFFGKIDGVKITAVTKNPDGKILDTQTGVTKYGIYMGKIYVPANLWSKGWYTIEISASSDIGTAQKTIEFYVAGQTPPKDGNSSP